MPFIRSQAIIRSSAYHLPGWYDLASLPCTNPVLCGRSAVAAMTRTTNGHQSPQSIKKLYYYLKRINTQRPFVPRKLRRSNIRPSSNFTHPGNSEPFKRKITHFCTSRWNKSQGAASPLRLLPHSQVNLSITDCPSIVLYVK